MSIGVDSVRLALGADTIPQACHIHCVHTDEPFRGSISHAVQQNAAGPIPDGNARYSGEKCLINGMERRISKYCSFQESSRMMYDKIVDSWVKQEDS
jgi:hypothetical protein